MYPKTLINLMVVGFSLSLLSYSAIAADKLSAEAIAIEYNDIRTKRLSGHYGKAGADIMKRHEIRLANHLSARIRAKECRDLQAYIPYLATGSYIFEVKQPKKAQSRPKRKFSIRSLRSPRAFFARKAKTKNKSKPAVDTRKHSEKLTQKHCVSIASVP